MSRKNWDRFFPPPPEAMAAVVAKGPGWQRWLLATTFVCLMTGAVVVVKVQHPVKIDPGATAQAPTGTATAEQSDYLEPPRPIAGSTDAAPWSEPVAIPTVPPSVGATPVPAPPAVEVVTPPPPSDLSPPTATPAPSARLMPPETPTTLPPVSVVVQNVAASPIGQEPPKATEPKITPTQAAALVGAPNVTSVVTVPSEGTRDIPPPSEPPPPPRIDKSDSVSSPAAMHNEGSTPPPPALPPSSEEVSPPPPCQTLPAPEAPLEQQPIAPPPPCPPPPALVAPPEPLSPPKPMTPAAVLPAPVRSGPLPLPELIPAVVKAQAPASPPPALPLTGSYACALEKQEVTLPATIRKLMDRPPVLYVGLGPDQQCLWVYTPADLDRLNEQLERLPGGDERVHRCRRLCFSRIEKVLIDGDGRVELPAELIEAAGLKKKLVLIGARDHFELWDAERWQQYSEPPVQ